MEYLAYIIVAVICIWIGWHIRGIVILSNLSENPDRVIKMLEQIKKINEQEALGSSTDIVEVSTEIVNGSVFAYDKATGEFLAQAQNLHQVMVLAAHRYPGKHFWHPELQEDSQNA